MGKYLGNREIKRARLDFESWRRSSNCPMRCLHTPAAHGALKKVGDELCHAREFEGGLPRKLTGGPVLEQEAHVLLCVTRN